MLLSKCKDRLHELMHWAFNYDLCIKRYGGYMRAAFIGLTGALLVSACGEPASQRVGREFLSMAECLEFIEKDMGEPLKAQTDKPTDVSGKGALSGGFFRCEIKSTGTRGQVLEGRWDRPK